MARKGRRRTDGGGFKNHPRLVISEGSGKKPRGPGRRWKPGQSGNLKGRPKIPAEYKAAIKMLDPMAGQALGDILANPKHPHRRQAAEYVWNRNHGMPRARHELSTPPGQPMELNVKRSAPTSAELRRELEALIAKGMGGAVAADPDES